MHLKGRLDAQAIKADDWSQIPSARERAFAVQLGLCQTDEGRDLLGPRKALGQAFVRALESDNEVSYAKLCVAS